MEWIVTTAEQGVRLDKFLAERQRLGSRRRASVALDRGKVFLNTVEVAPDAASVRLAAGDRIRVWMDRPGSARRRTPTQSGDLRIVFEDDALIVVDKPAGVLAVPLERKRQAPSVFDQLVSRFRSHGKRKPLTVHRIDRDTSGLVVFGHPDPSSGTWRDRLVWDHRALIQKETHPRDPRGKEAVCRYEVLERFRTSSLIEVRLHTGKRNQIRLQARLRGHTLVGERRYVYGPDQLRPIEFGRQALHAYRLEFAHPVSGEALRFEAPMPADLTALIARLRRSA